MHVGIIGGGLSGVALHHFLRHPNEILEKEERPGGLCRTFEKDGFHYDIGGHILFSKDAALMRTVEEALRGNVHHCRRNNQILFKDRYVKYPFENGLGALDKQEILECLLGFFQNPHPKPTNFGEWIYHCFGDGIAQKYLVPYNTKIWKLPPAEMGIEWVERVPRPPAEDVLKSALGIETEGYVHQLNFAYPTRGGIESLVTALRKPDLHLETGFEVRRIRRQNKSWLVSNGHDERRYDHLVVTAPLKEIIRTLDDVPAEVVEAVAKLRHNAVRVILVGVDNESLLDKSAIYIPDPAVVAHRVCYMGYFSRENVPRGKSSLIAEVTAPPGHELHSVSDDVLAERVVADLARVGIIDKRDVVTIDAHRSEHGYVVYDRPYQATVAFVHQYFARLGIDLLGRSAQFEYINMDEVIRRSQRLADELNRRQEPS